MKSTMMTRIFAAILTALCAASALAGDPSQLVKEGQSIEQVLSADWAAIQTAQMHAGDEITLVGQRLRAAREEINKLKAENDDLKKKIADQTGSGGRNERRDVQAPDVRRHLDHPRHRH